MNQIDWQKKWGYLKTPCISSPVVCPARPPPQMTYLVAAPLPAIPKAEGVRARPDSDLGLEVKILKVTEEKGSPRWARVFQSSHLTTHPLSSCGSGWFPPPLVSWGFSPSTCVKKWERGGLFEKCQSHNSSGNSTLDFGYFWQNQKEMVGSRARDSGDQRWGRGARMTGGGNALETENPSASPFFPGAQVGLVQEHLVQAGMLTFLLTPLWGPSPSNLDFCSLHLPCPTPQPTTPLPCNTHPHPYTEAGASWVFNQCELNRLLIQALINSYIHMQFLLFSCPRHPPIHWCLFGSSGSSKTVGWLATGWETRGNQKRKREEERERKREEGLGEERWDRDGEILPFT